MHVSKLIRASILAVVFIGAYAAAPARAYVGDAVTVYGTACHAWVGNGHQELDGCHWEFRADTADGFVVVGHGWTIDVERDGDWRHFRELTGTCAPVGTIKPGDVVEISSPEGVVYVGAYAGC